MLRQMLASTKYIILVVVFSIYAGSVALILYETAVVATVIFATVQEASVSSEGGRLLAVGLLAAIDVFLIAADGADRLEMRRVAKALRDAGLSADLDYAGRSVKGQHTQASRLGARARVRFEADTAVVEHRRSGESNVAFDAVAPLLVDALADERSE